MRKISIWTIIGGLATLVGFIASQFEVEKIINEKVEKRLRLKEGES